MTNGVITGATDITLDTRNPDTNIGLFGGTIVGKTLLVGSDNRFSGAQVYVTTKGEVLPNKVVASYLKEEYDWVPLTYMVTEGEFDYTQFANNFGIKDGGIEQWRFGFDKDDLPTTWSKVTLNINGIDYTKYWAKVLITEDITSDLVFNTLTLHDNNVKINNDGVLEFYGRCRYSKLLQSGVNNLINNSITTLSSQGVTYEDGVTVADYKNNMFHNNVEDSTLIAQNIDLGVDTSIPLYLTLNYFCDADTGGDINFILDVYKVSDGIIYGGASNKQTYNLIVPATPIGSRSSFTFKIPIQDLLVDHGVLLNLKRNAKAENVNDTFNGNVVISNFRMFAYFWRL